MRDAEQRTSDLNRPLVSVVIPVYNCERYVAEAVRSVLAQGLDHVELIVVDDGSTDGSLDVLDPLRDRVRIIRQDNGGVASARNRGLAAARGEYVAFLDADDWWASSRLAAQFAAIAAFPEAALILTDFCVHGPAGPELDSGGIRWKYRVFRHVESTGWGRVFPERQRVRWTDESGVQQQADAYSGNVSQWLFRGNFINTSSVLVRRDVIVGVGGFDELLTTEEDYDCWLRISRAHRVVFIDAALVGFRRRPGQLTRPDQAEQVLRNVLAVIGRAAAAMANEVGEEAVSGRLAAIHRDLGICCLRRGDRQSGRRHLMSSLRLRLFQPRAMALMMLAMLPAGAFGLFEKGRVRLRDRYHSR